MVISDYAELIWQKIRSAKDISVPGTLLRESIAEREALFREWRSRNITSFKT
jgi:hypothetical protein